MGSQRAHFTRRSPASAPKLSRRKPARKSPSTRSRSPVSDELRQQLAQIGRRLEALYATCVTVELALKQQNGDQDEEIAHCLMRNVTGPLQDQAQALHGIVKQLERRSAAGGAR